MLQTVIARPAGPITTELFEDPVLLQGDGRTYERAAITEWLRRGNATSPLTGKPLRGLTLLPNDAVKRAADARRAQLASPPAGGRPAPPGDAVSTLLNALGRVGCVLSPAAGDRLRTAEVDLECLAFLEPAEIAEIGLSPADYATLARGKDALARAPARARAPPPRRGAPPPPRQAAPPPQRFSTANAAGGGWTCKVCTFINQEMHLACTMCGSTRAPT